MGDWLDSPQIHFVCQKMFGFGNNKRIVLFDTLMQQVEEDEILAILGHELGHWKLGHTLSNFATTQAYFGAAFYVFSLMYKSEDLYAAFGFNDPSRPTPTIITLLLFFQTIWAPVDKVLSFILTVVSRINEFAADRFSVDLGMSKKLQSGLCKVSLSPPRIVFFIVVASCLLVTISLFHSNLLRSLVVSIIILTDLCR